MEFHIIKDKISHIYITYIISSCLSTFYNIRLVPAPEHVAPKQGPLTAKRRGLYLWLCQLAAKHEHKNGRMIVISKVINTT